MSERGNEWKWHKALLGGGGQLTVKAGMAARWQAFVVVVAIIRAEGSGKGSKGDANHVVCQ